MNKVFLNGAQMTLRQGAIMLLARVKDYDGTPLPGHYRFLSVVLHSRLIVLLPSLAEY